jgi:hypothetical protein
LSTYLQSLAKELPIIDFYKTTFPTNAMKIAVAGIFTEMMKLLDEALVYYRSGRLSEMKIELFILDPILTRPQANFWMPYYSQPRRSLTHTLPISRKG